MASSNRTPNRGNSKKKDEEIKELDPYRGVYYKNAADAEFQRKSQIVTAGIGSYNYDFDAITRRYNIRYGRSYSTFMDLITSFNVARLPDIDGMVMPYVGHIIFTRPSLYVDVNGGNGQAGANYAAMRSNPLTAAVVADRYGKAILESMSEFSPYMYMPMFHTRAMAYNVSDVGIKTVEKGQTYYGHVIKYGKHSEEHKMGGSITIDFRNDYYQSILKAVQIWASYIMIVSKNDSIVPSDTSQMNAILDYPASIYYLVTGMDMSRLCYWEKLTGVYPKNIPFSIFSYNDGPWVEDKVSIEFDYGLRSDPCDPDVLFDLNTLSGGSYQMASAYLSGGVSGRYREDINYRDRTDYYNSRRFEVRADSYERPFGLGDAFAHRPIIQAVQSNGTLNYYLQWTL